MYFSAGILSKTIANTGKNAPLLISTHIPFSLGLIQFWALPALVVKAKSLATFSAEATRSVK